MPGRLDPRALETPVTPGMREMPRAIREEMLAKRRGLWDRFRPFGLRRKTRLSNWVVGAVVLLPVMNWLFLPLPLRTLPAQVLVAALYGLLAGWTRLAPFAAGAALELALLATLWLTGRFDWVTAPGMRLVLGFYFAIGMAVGYGDDLRRADGD